MSSDDYVIGKGTCEDVTTEAFESDFLKVTDRTAEIVGGDDPPDVIELIDGIDSAVAYMKGRRRK